MQTTAAVSHRLASLLLVRATDAALLQDTPAVQTAMPGGMAFDSVRDAIFTHPTMVEGLSSLLASIPKVS